MFRQVIPLSVRQRLRGWWRRFRDWRSGQHRLLQSPRKGHPEQFPFAVTIEQPFLESDTLANKQHNIQLAVQRLRGVVIEPGQVFSFWKWVGPPMATRGFLSGRNIVNGQLSVATGGGLCQLSGIVYHTALIAGLDIVERHAHTFDLYWNNEQQRYTPIGTDATVVFGYKDLRFKNNLTEAVCLDFLVAPQRLCCFLKSKNSIQHLDLQITRTDKPAEIEVIVQWDDQEIRSVYRK
jgi:vancomycin resistance protein VanW